MLCCQGRRRTRHDYTDFFATRDETCKKGPKPVSRLMISSRFRPRSDLSRRRRAITRNGRRSRRNLCERGSLAADSRTGEGGRQAAALSALSLKDLLEGL